MIEYIQGKLITKNPAFVVIDIGGMAYHINISINSYEKISRLEESKLLIHLSIKEDAHVLYGFFEESERALFRNLISVSGIGTNTAMLILSSLKTSELINAIITGNISLLKSVKGVGPKTAQRLVLELQDSLLKKGEVVSKSNRLPTLIFDDAIGALTMLGFKKSEAEKAVIRIINENPDISTVEDVIKLSLKSINQ
jgi:holliday junction DNA helicase RuvA